MTNHQKHIQAHLEAIAGISSIKRGNPREIELAPDFVFHIECHEVALKNYFSNPYNRTCSVSGQYVYKWQWDNYLKHKGYYTSPLYKALS